MGYHSELDIEFQELSDEYDWERAMWEAQHGYHSSPSRCLAIDECGMQLCNGDRIIADTEYGPQLCDCKAKPLPSTSIDLEDIPF